MISVTLSFEQLEILLEALDYYLEGFSEQDNKTAYRQTTELRITIIQALNDIPTEIIEGDTENG